jgi:hypothetical protein
VKSNGALKKGKALDAKVPREEAGKIHELII